MCMNKKSTDCADLKLTILGLCSLQERKEGKANDNLGKSVNFFTSYKEIWLVFLGIMLQQKRMFVNTLGEL